MKLSPDRGRVRRLAAQWALWLGVLSPRSCPWQPAGRGSWRGRNDGEAGGSRVRAAAGVARFCAVAERGRRVGLFAVDALLPALAMLAGLALLVGAVFALYGVAWDRGWFVLVNQPRR